MTTPCADCEELIQPNEECLWVCEHTRYHSDCASRVQQHQENHELVLQCETCSAQRAVQLTLYEPYLFSLISIGAHLYLGIQFFVYLISLCIRDAAQDRPSFNAAFGLYLLSGMVLMIFVLFCHAKVQYEGKFALPAAILDGVLGGLWIFLYGGMLPVVWSILTLPDMLYITAILTFSLTKFGCFAHHFKMVRHLIYETGLEAEQPGERDWIQTATCSFCGRSSQQGLADRSPCGHYRIHTHCLHEHTTHGAQLECAYCGKLCRVRLERTFWLGRVIALFLALGCSILFSTITIIYVYTNPVDDSDSDEEEEDIPSWVLVFTGIAALFLLQVWLWMCCRPTKSKLIDIYEKCVSALMTALLLLTMIPLFLLPRVMWQNFGWTLQLLLFCHAPYVSDVMGYMIPALRRFTHRHCYLMQPISKQS